MKDPRYRARHLPKGQRQSLKLESLSEQNAYPALWQIADPYIGSAEFLFIEKIKKFFIVVLL